MRAQSFVPFAEAAFIAGLSDRQMNRIVDEHLVPAALLEQHGTTRRFARLAAAFARFYFDTEPMLVAATRRDVVEELFLRVQHLRAREDVLALIAMPEEADWKVGRHAIEIDVSRYIAQAFMRAKEVDDAEALVTEDPEVMGGQPCFAGTRVPIDIVLASLAEGMSIDEVREAYPFLTDTHVAAARVYTKVHPRRGRPRRMRHVVDQKPRETIKVSGTSA